ncbi:hypothetical protein BURMUCF2_1539 [Burkholderia multivorans CF2]|nr:hypothetical protein BURMUCF2_1539 [Burkholderia multivorans CF2]
MVRPFSKADIVTQDKGFPYIEFVIPKMRRKAAGAMFAPFFVVKQPLSAGRTR